MEAETQSDGWRGKTARDEEGWIETEGGRMKRCQGRKKRLKDLKGWVWRKRRKKGMWNERREATERREGGDGGQREERKRYNMMK